MHTSDASNAHGMTGMWSRTTSGSGGYLSISGTRSWTNVITPALANVTAAHQRMLNANLNKAEGIGSTIRLVGKSPRRATSERDDRDRGILYISLGTSRMRGSDMERGSLYIVSLAFEKCGGVSPPPLLASCTRGSISADDSRDNDVRR